MSRIILIIAFLGASIVVGFFYFSPEWERYQELRSDVGELEKIAEEMDDLIAKRDELLKTLNTVPRSDLDRLLQAVPEGPKASELLVILEALAKQRGIALLGVDLQTTEEPTGSSRGQPYPGAPVAIRPSDGTFKELLAGFGVSGTYAAFKNFLGDLERSLRIMDVRDISFQGGSDDVFKYSLNVKAYYQ